MVLLKINGILALIKHMNFYFLSMIHMSLISPDSLKQTWKKKWNAFPIQQTWLDATITVVPVINCLIYLGKISPSPFSNPRQWLTGRAAMIIYNSVIEEKKELWEPHEVIWILTESLPQSSQTASPWTGEHHLRLCAGTHEPSYLSSSLNPHPK